MQDAGGEEAQDQAEVLADNEKRLPEHDDDAGLTASSRLWFLSSAFPMIAGTLGPVASAFSICALVKPWRQSLPPGASIQTAQFIDDPTWLTVINALQLVIALIANVSLLLNMTRRLRFAVAQPVTILGWYISAFTLMALAATAAGPLKAPGPFVWSQAWYYGVYSAVLYFLDATLMLGTFWGALRGWYDKDFDLTASQRTLMLQTIMFLVYLLLGALVFSKIEGWDYLDAVYWADVTLFTVGFGDFAASTTLGRALLFPYALIGVISLGLVIGSIRGLVLDRAKRRLDARMVERKRRKIVRTMTRRGNEILEPVREDGLTTAATNETGWTEFERREEEFKLMRSIQHQAALRRRWVAMATSTGTTLVLWLVGAKIFQECESEWQPFNYFDGVYFGFVSLTTIGYGDVTPISNSGKAFFVFWSLLALPTMTVLISNAGDTIVKSIRDGTDQLGTITILPGERGFKKEVKLILKALSCGTLFGEDEEVHEQPAGFLGDANPVHGADADTDDDDEDDDATRVDTKVDEEHRPGQSQASPASQAGGSSSPAEKEPVDRQSSKPSPTAMKKLNTNTSTQSSSRSNKERGSPRRPRTSQSGNADYPSGFKRAMSMPRQDIPAEIPTGVDYHILLIEEIKNVTQHLKSHPPRKYTFQEWAWYLKLIGEDESNPDTHRKAMPHVHHKGSGRLRDGNGKDNGNIKNGNNRSAEENPDQIQSEDKTGDSETKTDGEHHIQWSWVGARSPLMSSREEAEWILEKLTQKLAQELRQIKVDELNKGRLPTTAESKS